MSKGILLINLGSPDSTDVRRRARKYLRQFLMDGRVIDALAYPFLRRQNSTHPAVSGKNTGFHAYQQIWTSEGSPLIATSKHLQHKLQERFPVPVELAMRYQNPSIESAIRKLDYLKVDEVLLIPLFPHYAMSSYESAV